MGRVLHVIRDALVLSLGGCTRSQVQQLCRRANILSVLSKRGKYDLTTALMVGANARIIRRLTKELGLGTCGLQSREPVIREVEIIQRRSPLLLPASTYKAVDEARAFSLLAEIAGPLVGAQLDIQRQCVESVDEKQGLQGEK